MSDAEQFDMVVIGAGQAGPFLAARLVGQGRKIALVEARDLGGTCVNRGCTPTKTLRKSARVAHLMSRAGDFGIGIEGIKVDFAAAMQRMQRRVDESRAGLQAWLGGLDGLTIVKAHGRLIGPGTNGFRVQAGERLLEAPQIILNTGTRPYVPTIPGLSSVPYLDNESILALRELPRKLVIIGGGYISLELGQIFRRLGSKVAIIEPAERLTPREDPDVSEMLATLLRDEGVELLLGQTVASVSPGDTPGGVCVGLADGRTIGGSHLLIAAGRVPNTDDLGLESLGVTTSPRGYVPTDDQLQTNVMGIWALGDINQRGAFTHTSYHDHQIFADNLAGAKRSAADRPTIYSMFTDPPLAHVGLYETEARKLVTQGRRISMAVHAMKDVSRAKEEGETAGVIKLLIDEDSGHFLGATILGIEADEIIQAISLVMACKGTWQQVHDALPVHPTVTEFLPTIIAKRKPLRDD